MKIGILGDPHLGASFALGTKDPISQINSRLLDYRNTLLRALEDLKAAGSQYLVITGDIFETRTPSLKQQEVFSEAIWYAKHLFDAVNIIIGNHDQYRSGESHTLAYLDALKLDRVHIHSNIESVFLRENLRLIVLPYRDRNFYKQSASNALAEIKEQIDKCKARHGSHILIGHMAIEGALPMMEAYTDLYDGNELALPVSFFDDIDFTVMGHIHTPGYVTPRIYYVGSMEKRAAFEAETKSAVVLDTNSWTLQQIPLKCKSIIQKSIQVNGIKKETINEHILGQFGRLSVDDNVIVKIDLELQEQDKVYLNTAAITDFLTRQYPHVEFQAMRISAIVTRQARDTNGQIARSNSAAEAFRNYVAANHADFPDNNTLITTGLSLLE